MLAILISTSFVVAIIVYFAVNLTPYPKISKEAQEKFSEEYAEVCRQGGYAIGGCTSHLKYGEFKYDNEISISDLYDINASRQRVIQKHAKNLATMIFWILIIGMPLVRYIFLLKKWLSQK